MAALRTVVADAVATQQKHFQFQEASAAAQEAHLVSLLESQTCCWGAGREIAALDCLHRLTLEGYVSWLEDAELGAPTPTRSEEAWHQFRDGEDVSDAAAVQIYQLALWLLASRRADMCWVAATPRLRIRSRSRRRRGHG